MNPLNREWSVLTRLMAWSFRSLLPFSIWINGTGRRPALEGSPTAEHLISFLFVKMNEAYQRDDIG